MKVEVKNFRAQKKGSLVGFVDVHLPEFGITIKSCTIFESQGREWINPPSRQWVDKEGKTKYSPWIEFSKENYKEFCEKSVEAYKNFINNTPAPPVQQNEFFDIPF